MTYPVKHFTSDMRGAPVLAGQAGSLIALLDACLVTGFGVVTASSVVITGGIATAAIPSGTAHALDGIVLVDGATPAGLNGEQRVVASSATSVSWATALPDGAATGTITIKQAPAAWAKAFAGTNLAAYKSLDPQAHGGGMLLRVDDAGTTSARVVGYESMTDISTGLGPFPTPAQISGGGYWVKSTVASATAVRWALFADSRFFILHVNAGYASNAANVHGVTRGFGDSIPLRPAGDAFAVALNYATTSTANAMYRGGLDMDGNDVYHAMPRAITGLGSSFIHALIPYVGNMAGLSGADTGALGSFPSQVDGSLSLSRRYYAQGTNGWWPRAVLPGLYSMPQSAGFTYFNLGDRVPGGGDLAGRTLMAICPANVSLTTAPTASNAGVSFVDITGPWR